MSARPVLLDLLTGCRSPADFYRVQIRLDNESTIDEITELLPLRDSLPAPVVTWLNRMLVMYGATGTPPQRFVREPVSDNLLLYRGRVGARTGRGLLLAFCGNSNRLMLPISVVLQCVPASAYDLLLVRDPSGRLYAGGVPGYADDIPGLAARLRDWIAAQGYARVRSLGASAGGGPALYVGALAGASHALAFGGFHLSDPAMAALRERFGIDGEVFDRALDGADISATRMLAVYGQGYPPDLERAQTLRRRLPSVRPVAIEGVNSHNIPDGLLIRRALAGFLNRALLGDPDPRFYAPLQSEFGLLVRMPPPQVDPDIIPDSKPWQATP